MQYSTVLCQYRCLLENLTHTEYLGYFSVTSWNENDAKGGLCRASCAVQDIYPHSRSCVRGLGLGRGRGRVFVVGPQEYKVADHTRSCPPVERVSLPLSPQERLSHLQIAHFTACLRCVFRFEGRVVCVGATVCVLFENEERKNVFSCMQHTAASESGRQGLCNKEKELDYGISIYMCCRVCVWV